MSLAMLVKIENIKVPGDKDESSLPEILFLKYGIKSSSIKILKKSLDARNKDSIFWSYNIAIEVDDLQGQALLQYYKEASPYIEQRESPLVKITKSTSVIIIGTGPAGLFCGLVLALSGVKVIFLERGCSVDERMGDIELLESSGLLNPESNVLFGEGGAGTYSDGKLTARTHTAESQRFYKILIDHGASPSIEYESKPHIGTDNLRVIIKNIRNRLLSLGAEIFFKCKVVDLIISDNRLRGVITSDGREFIAERVVAATGHSARDFYSLLLNKGVAMEKKGFAIGSRLEHPAELIRSIQYGRSHYRDILPPAEYSLTWTDKNTGRGVYSFCMCPGGFVINSSSEEARLCTNGMSLSSRNGKFSNSAIVVSVFPEDIKGDIASAIEFQRTIERLCFNAGGGSFRAPAQRLTSFLKGKGDFSLPQSSYKNGITIGKLDDFLPEWITAKMRQALPYFEKRMPGFITDEAIFIGAETRTSSPVRILRNKDFQSLTVKGLYPTGEGSGYSGGIVSSAVDGIKCADAIICELA